MKISTKGRYAVRLMYDLAMHHTGDWIALSFGGKSTTDSTPTCPAREPRRWDDNKESSHAMRS